MNKDLLVLGVAGLIGYWLLTKTARPVAGAGQGGANFAPQATAADQGFGSLVASWDGWRYYDSGYARDAAGNIYYNGAKLT